jgi:DNA-binding winged helix-turn-helix (wHTH) protein/TolB-like protein/cytochrome c-type biogenesis protein CcmH/NrfG
VRYYEFNGFRLDALKRQLCNSQGEAQDLPARAFDALLFLLQHRGEDVSKDQLMKAVWPSTVVEENNLNQAIFAVRRALGDTASDPHFIMTLPGRGYRFIAELTAPTPETAGPRVSLRARVGIISAVGLVAIAVAVLWWLGSAGSGSTGSVAVLPFKALLPDQSDPALELGMTDTLISRISTLPGVTVSSLNSVRRFSAVDLDALAAGRQLGVEAVLESSIVTQGERIRVTSRLLRVRDGKGLWSGKFDEPISGILEVQDAIAERVMTALAPRLSAADTRRSPRPTDNTEAYQLYVGAYYNQTRRDQDGLPAAVEKYEAALLLDPGYVDAWGGLSRALISQGTFGTRPPMSVFPRAKEAALRAVELDPESAGAQAALAHVLVQYDQKYAQAAPHYARAMQLDPQSAEILLLSSINQMQLGHVTESLAQARHAVELEPAGLLFATNLGMLLYIAHSYDEAEATLQRIVELQPQFDHAQNLLGQTLLARGDIAGALAHFAARSNPTPGSYINPGRAYALAGRKQEARAEIDKLKGLAARGFGVSYALATIHAALGEKRLACEALEQALMDRSTGFLSRDPSIDPLRGEPCFAAVSRKLYPDPGR